MSTNLDFDRVASSWLATGPTELNDRVLKAALDEVHLTRQRRRWSAPWRFPYMPMLTRATVSTAAILIAVVGVGGALYLTSNPAGSSGKPSPTPVSTPVATSLPTISPSATATSAYPTFPPVDSAIAAGTYRAGAPFQLPDLTFEVPTGWNSWSGVRSRVISMQIDSRTEEGSNGAFVNFALPFAVYADPCKTGSTVAVPNLGPTVDDFVAALSNLPKFTVGPITDVLVDGFPGKRFDFTNSVPSNGAGCTGDALINVWSAGDVGGVTLPGAAQHLVVVDVRGTRLVIEVLYGDPIATFDDEINSIIDSVRFE